MIILLQGLYDNKNLRSFRDKKKRKKTQNIDTHLRDIDSSVAALDNIQIVSNDKRLDMIFANRLAIVSLNRV